jgi:TetR/AcrR family transcriptional regulator
MVDKRKDHDMNSSFEKLDKKKQDKILDAAIIEFSKSGYEKASTNKIVEHAGIGKGMLFHYFNSKKELFNDLVEISIKYVEEDFINQIDRSKSDFIEKSKSVAQAKMNAMKKNRKPFDLMGQLYLHNFEGMSEDQIERGKKIQKELYKVLYEDVDTSYFREDIAPEVIMKLIQWSIEGYQSELIKKLEKKELSAVNYDEDWKEFYAFLETLKKIYYK